MVPVTEQRFTFSEVISLAEFEILTVLNQLYFKQGFHCSDEQVGLCANAMHVGNGPHSGISAANDSLMIDQFEIRNLTLIGIVHC